MQGFKRIKKLKNASHSTVYLLINTQREKAIEKIYDSKYVTTFEHELKVLQRLKNCPFVPKLLHVDVSKRKLFLSYCGAPALSTSENRKQVKLMVSKLEIEYGVIRTALNSMNPMNSMKRFFEWWREDYGKTLHNVMEKDGQLYLIDFGSKTYVIRE